MKIISEKIIPIKNDDGFTLVEILVSILIMVTVVTLTISFYLFANKFIRTTSLGFDEREKINRFIFNLSETINKSTSFDLLTNQNLVLIQLNNNKRITFSDKVISIGNPQVADYELKNIGSYKFFIHFENGSSLIINSKRKIIKGEKILIEQVSSMDIEINYNSKTYLIKYFKPQISTLKFINIE